MHPSLHVHDVDGNRGARTEAYGAGRGEEFRSDVRHRTAIREARRNYAAHPAAQNGPSEAVPPAGGLERRCEIFIGAHPNHSRTAGAVRRGRALKLCRLKQCEIRLGVRLHLEAPARKAPRAHRDGRRDHGRFRQDMAGTAARTFPPHGMAVQPRRFSAPPEADVRAFEHSAAGWSMGFAVPCGVDAIGGVRRQHIGEAGEAAAAQFQNCTGHPGRAKLIGHRLEEG